MDGGASGYRQLDMHLHHQMFANDVANPHDPLTLYHESSADNVRNSPKARISKHSPCLIFIGIMHFLLNVFIVIVGISLIIMANFFIANDMDHKKTYLQELMRESDPKMPEVMVKNGAYVVTYVMDYGLAYKMLIFGIVMIVTATMSGLAQLIIRKKLAHKFALFFLGLLFCLCIILLSWILIDPPNFKSQFEIPIKKALHDIAMSTSFSAIWENTTFAFGSSTYCCERFFPKDPNCVPGVSSCMKILKNYHLMYLGVFVIPMVSSCVILLTSMLLHLLAMRIITKRVTLLQATKGPL